VLGIAVKLKWREAIPLLEKYCANPGAFNDYCSYYFRLRQLTVKPVAPELEEAKATIKKLGPRRSGEDPSPDEIARAKRTLTQGDDIEPRILFAIQLTYYNSSAGKGGRHNQRALDAIESVKPAGEEILQQLPRDETIAFLRPLAESLPKLTHLQQLLSMLER
jgi:hypothetical protein